MSQEITCTRGHVMNAGVEICQVCNSKPQQAPVEEVKEEVEEEEEVEEVETEEVVKEISEISQDACNKHPEGCPKGSHELKE